jgi:dephospho-CoA kinase
MFKVGITGGIGSGKTTVCQVFETLGIPVFYSDRAAKYLMEHDADIISQIRELFGEQVYSDGVLQRDAIADIAFSHPHKLQQLNEAVHPATIKYGKQWVLEQDAPYVLKEAAIFFESGSYKDMDVMIGVSAPEKVRIFRSMTRDGVSQDQVTRRMARQMNEEEKMKLCDIVIINDDRNAILPQVLDIHQQLLQRAAAR